MLNLIMFSEQLYSYLKQCGIRFTSSGYPIVPNEMLLTDPPEEIIPFHCRNGSRFPKAKTALCTFTGDDRIYPRLAKLEEDIPTYSEYKGFCGFDLSPRITWDIRQQKFNILLSQMTNIYLGLYGIKFYPNFRVGAWDTINALSAYPANSVFAVGALGCAKGATEFNIAYMRAKIMFTRPALLLIYGSLIPAYKTVLDDIGVDYIVYDDFRKVCRNRKEAA